MSNNIYDILGKLNVVKNLDKPAEPTAPEPIYESVKPRGSILEAIKSLEEKYTNFKKELNEGLNPETAHKLLNGDLDLYSAVSNGKGISQAEQQYLQNMYDDAAREYGLHADDDFEDIFQRMLDWLEADYGVEEGKDDLTDIDDYKFADADTDTSVAPAQAKSSASNTRQRLQDLADRRAEKDDWFSGKDKESNVRVHHARHQDQPEELDEYSQAEYDQATADFKAKGGRAQQLPPGAAKNPISTASRHIAGRGEAKGGKVAGRGANVSASKPVVDVYEGLADKTTAELKKDFALYKDLKSKGVRDEPHQERLAVELDKRMKKSDDKKASVARESIEVDEVAPPGAKAERMVKHIKKGYADDGKLTKREKGIAYATAWKAKKAGHLDESSFGDMPNKEGIVVMGAGGDPNEWIDGIFDLWKKEGIAGGDSAADAFDNHMVLKTTGGRTDLVLPFKDGADLQMGKMAMWRLRFGDCSWISDYKDNYAEQHGYERPNQDHEDDEDAYEDDLHEVSALQKKKDAYLGTGVGMGYTDDNVDDDWENLPGDDEASFDPKAYRKSREMHNKTTQNESVEFKDKIKNSAAKMTKAKPAKLKEARVMEDTDYFYEQVGKALAEKDPTLDTASSGFAAAVRKEMVAQGIDPNRARNILLMDEDFLSDVASSYDHYCQEIVQVEAVFDPAQSNIPAPTNDTPVTSSVDDELNEIARLAGLSAPIMDEGDDEYFDEVSETTLGNEFTQAMESAVEAGETDFEVAGERYTVKEDINISVNANGQEDAVNLIRKLAGMPVVVVQAADTEAPEETCLLCDSSPCVCEQEVDEERDIEHANTPHEQTAPVSAAIPSGTDLHRAKASYSNKPYRGDNPMAEAKEAALWKQYESLINDVKE